MSIEYRDYFFGNMYLSSIQQGIQALHVTHELFLKYPEHGASMKSEVLWEWAREHKTVVLLNGGYQEELYKILSFFRDKLTPMGFPYACFKEEDASLNGALTSVGCVLPVYDGETFGKKEVRNKSELEGEAPTYYPEAVYLEDEHYKFWEINNFIRQYRLAA